MGFTEGTKEQRSGGNNEVVPVLPTTSVPVPIDGFLCAIDGLAGPIGSFVPMCQSEK